MTEQIRFYFDEHIPFAIARELRRQGGQRMPAVTVFLAQENARKTLEAGVTTVRDLGASEYMDIAMRDLINRGAMLGPRMFVSGYGLHSTPRTAPEGTALSRGRVW